MDEALGEDTGATTTQAADHDGIFVLRHVGGF